MDDPQTRPVSDPEREGLPGTADDDSSAYDDVDSARIADGPDPAALPADRPMASLDYGTTPAEARTPEPLDDRLDREEPDVTPDTGAANGSPDDDPGSTGITAAEQLPATDDPTELPADELVDSDESSSGADDGSAGRLLRPDEGAHPDEEGTEVAADTGASGGGLSAEEAAMHLDE
ncbi:hypothetical protein E1218_23070 [Kribbella turkmenica]|uniref:DUF5709 domain-containing protein n=1 Tax=Kribbella turkmenica TaxID=2530375 RepID=A0A4R4WS26_9ACTN|nr:DUF5709 domain-containing protein [Kribbella turkmenica]TDD19970.1 hypothetical protein E1218_23070 [Kribbella turkmenica]